MISFLNLSDIVITKNLEVNTHQKPYIAEDLVTGFIEKGAV
jgi:hypothetical protein